LTTGDSSKPVDILLVEDNPGDARLAIEALSESTVPNTVHAVRDGEEAMAFLHQEGKYASSPRPDIILLDLNLPKKDGREVLAEIKEDPDLKSIPVVVMTTSNAEDDIRKTYNLHVNCYVTKPVELDHFMKVIKSLEDFWLATVRLPSR
jgi:chemotaxis family two-component system response regulator Rcp1